jgi:DnaJ-class molecular chaperone
MTNFEILGLSETATLTEVKVAWRQLAMVHHPDKGGDATEFSRLRKAYDQALAEASAPKFCDVCRGTGKVKQISGWSSIDLVCSACQGAGSLACAN